MLHAVVALLGVALLALLGGQIWDYAAPGGARLAPVACNDTNNCTRDMALGDTTCRNEPYGLTHACQSICYQPRSNTTYCDGMGTCVGDASECLGTCETSDDCDAVMDLSAVGGTWACTEGGPRGPQCVGSITKLLGILGDEAYPDITPTGGDCLALLKGEDDDVVPPLARLCLVAERRLRPVEEIMQRFVCTYRFACSGGVL